MTGKRLFDLLFATALLCVGLLPMLVVAALIKLVSRGPVLYWSDRVGKDNQLFRMPKFRTMRVDTPQVATHLLLNANRWMIPFGGLIRAASLDELPQVWSILRGDMSFVGPRPALFNQHDLMDARTAEGVHRLTPGLTGWAQVNGRDELSIQEKVRYDAHYLRARSWWLDLKIIALTVVSVLRRDGIKSADASPADKDEPAERKEPFSRAA